MKYVISDQNEFKIGNGYHFELAKDFKGEVIRAGHCNKNDDGTFTVFDGSIGFKIQAQEEDAKILYDLSNNL